LWERALPHLTTPVKARNPVQWLGQEARGLVAGMTALASYTNLGDDPIPTFALRPEQYRSGLQHEDYVRCELPEDARSFIETWAYDPPTLAADERVDRLSLYLSLRHSADERVQKALETLLEGTR
jgi:hypothetical protein